MLQGVQGLQPKNALAQPLPRQARPAMVPAKAAESLMQGVECIIYISYLSLGSDLLAWAGWICYKSNCICPSLIQHFKEPFQA